MSDEDLPRFRPHCIVCERPFLGRAQERYLECLRRRRDYLRDVVIPRSVATQPGKVAYLRQEMAALEWVLRELEPATPQKVAGE